MRELTGNRVLDAVAVKKFTEKCRRDNKKGCQADECVRRLTLWLGREPLTGPIGPMIL